MSDGLSEVAVCRDYRISVRHCDWAESEQMQRFLGDERHISFRPVDVLRTAEHKVLRYCGRDLLLFVVAFSSVPIIKRVILGGSSVKMYVQI
jgi:hypothetical protein